MAGNQQPRSRALAVTFSDRVVAVYAIKSKEDLEDEVNSLEQSQLDPEFGPSRLNPLKTGVCHQASILPS